MASRWSAPREASFMNAIPLAPPPLPSIDERLTWRGTLVVVIGADAVRFASRITERLRARSISARSLRVELRHREGASLEDGPDAVLRCHPDSLRAELAHLVPNDARAITIGAGAPLAAAVHADLVVWIRGGESLLALSPAEHALASEARLVLEQARDGTADALADELARAGTEGSADL